MTQLVDRHVPDIDVVDAHPARSDVLQAGDERRQRRLARACRPDESQCLSGLDREVETLQGQPLGIGEMEIDIVEAQLPAVSPDLGSIVDTAVGIGDVVPDVDDLPVPAGGGERHERIGEQEAEHFDGHAQHHRDRHCRHDRADRRPAFDDSPGAHGDDRRLRQSRQQQKHAPQPRVELRLADLQGLQPGRDLGEALGGPGGAAEGLEDADALNGFLDVRGQFAHRVLRPAGGLAVVLLEDGDRDDRRHRHDDHDQTEHRLHDHEHHRADGEHDRCGEEERQTEREEATQLGQIIHRAREQLAGLPGIMDRHRGVLQTIEQTRTPRHLPMRDDGSDDHAPRPHSDRLGDADEQHPENRQPQGRQIAVGDGPVDDVSGDHRDDELDSVGQESEDEYEGVHADA